MSCGAPREHGAFCGACAPSSYFPDNRRRDTRLADLPDNAGHRDTRIADLPAIGEPSEPAEVPTRATVEAAHLRDPFDSDARAAAVERIRAADHTRRHPAPVGLPVIRVCGDCAHRNERGLCRMLTDGGAFVPVGSMDEPLKACPLRTVREAPATPAPESAAHDRRVAVRVLRWADGLCEVDATSRWLTDLADAIENGTSPVPGEEDVKR